MKIIMMADLKSASTGTVVIPKGPKVDVLVTTGGGWIVRDGSYRVWFVPLGYAGEVGEE